MWKVVYIAVFLFILFSGNVSFGFVIYVASSTINNNHDSSGEVCHEICMVWMMFKWN